MMQTVIQLMQQHPAELQRAIAIDEIMELPDNRPSFLPLASGDEPSQPAILEVAGTELRIGGECVGYLSLARSNPEETLCVLLDPDSRQQRLTCSVQFADASVPTKRRSFSLRLIDKPQGFQPEHREELYRFRRVKKP